MTETNHIPLVEATEDQLRTFATTILGLDIHHAAKTESITAKIKQAWTKDTIPVPNPVETSEAPAGTPPQNPNPAPVMTEAPKPAPRTNSSKGDPLVRMYMERSDKEGGDRPVPVSVNGSTMLIPRGEECDVPYRYYLVLINAVRTVFEPDDDGELQPRDVLAYPFRVVKMPEQGEIDTWEAEQVALSERQAKAA